MKQIRAFRYPSSVVRSQGRLLNLAGAVFAACLLSFAAPAQVKVELVDGKGAGAPSYSYRFENQRFHISLVEIDLDGDGDGVVKFKRGESDDVIDLKLKLLPDTLARIRHLHQALRFVESDEKYQSEKDHSNLGWVTVIARAGGRERQARFNYTHNQEMKELADIYRGLSTQQIHLFDLETAQQYQPLDVPRLLENLENDLKLERLTEPAALLASLRDISSSDAAPLIARNHATRIIAGIEKGKFKTPIKK